MSYNQVGDAEGPLPQMAANAGGIPCDSNHENEFGGFPAKRLCFPDNSRQLSGRDGWESTRPGNAGSDDDLQWALAQSASLAESTACDESRDLQRALQESALGAADASCTRPRALMGLAGPFQPAGLLNSGNSCFWNALVQALFAATPVFRGALFQLDLNRKSPEGVLAQLCDLFAEMDMGLASAIDAGELYRRLFPSREEADASEQMQRLFQLASMGPPALKAVWRELFSGDLYEEQRSGSVRRVPLDICQLDICVRPGSGCDIPGPQGRQPEVPPSLENLLVAHTSDVQGNISRRSYRLPPVLWVNLDRFAYDRTTHRARKRHDALAFPGVLNAWMLVPSDQPWVQGLRRDAAELQELRGALEENQGEVTRHSSLAAMEDEDARATLANLVDVQEQLMERIERLDAKMAAEGAEQELLYRLEAVIVHSGRVDTGHYFAYARSPVPSPPAGSNWVRFNDAKVETVSAAQMRKVCEGVAPQRQAAELGARTALDFQAAACQPSAAQCGPGQGVQLSDPSGLPVPEVDAAQRRSGKLRERDVCPPLRPARSRTGTGGNIWGAVTAAFACLAGKGGADEAEEVVTAGASRSRPRSSEDPPAPGVEPPGQRSRSSDAASSSPEAAGPAAGDEDFTAARCLVYVRCGAADNEPRNAALAAEVKQRVAPAVQEQIHQNNVKFLQECAQRVAEDFALCAQALGSVVSTDQGDGQGNAARLREELEAPLSAARAVRAEGGMGRARMLLLRACWRLHVPWLPEELQPHASPPDFRMHYGATAKRALLDALLRLGQHDVASAIVADTAADSDAFVPPATARWLAEKGHR